MPSDNSALFLDFDAHSVYIPIFYTIDLSHKIMLILYNLLQYIISKLQHLIPDCINIDFLFFSRYFSLLGCFEYDGNQCLYNLELNVVIYL